MYAGKKKKWLVKASHSEKEKMARAESLALEMGLHAPTAQLLINRGCNDAVTAQDFLSKKTELLHDPFLMHDMERAAKKIIETAASGKKIVIYGDYDVDGVTSVSILQMYLDEIGADADNYIPSRLSEGYGMSEASLSRIAAGGTQLIITVDTGISSVPEAELIKQLGMELIITDHHECHGELPQAFAVVNPRCPGCGYPFKELAGVGVVFKLLCAMERIRSSDGALESVRRVCEKYIDLVALGTVADVMPLKDENRLIVSHGLAMIESSPRISLECLLQAACGDAKPQKKRITSGYIGYTIAPRINAAGRIRDASIAVELFLCHDTDRVKQLAEELCEINTLRQQEENKITSEAFEMIEAEHDFAHDPVIVLSHESWHHGIIGIVASRIAEKYCRPCVLISFDGSDGKTPEAGKGSGRSIKGMNLVNALEHCGDLLVKFGGHELAAGLTIERGKLDEFRRRINDYARGCFDGAAPVMSAEAEYELLPSETTMEQANELYLLEPFGVSNPMPVFVMYNMTVSSVSSVGQGKHSKLMLARDSLVICAMYFRHSPAELEIYPGDTVDVMFTLEINEYQNIKSLQFNIKDMRLNSGCGISESEKSLYEKLHGGTFDKKLADPEQLCDLIPVRSDFAAVYTLVRRELRGGREKISISSLLYMLSRAGAHIRYVKLRYILLVFREMNILGVEQEDCEAETYRFSEIHSNTKADLEKSCILRKLKTTLAGKPTNK